MGLFFLEDISEALRLERILKMGILRRTIKDIN